MNEIGESRERMVRETTRGVERKMDDEVREK